MNHSANLVPISTGFFLAILVVNQQGYNLRELHFAVMIGLAGAFVCLASLTLIKGALARL